MVVALVPALADLHVLGSSEASHDPLGPLTPVEQTVSLSCSQGGSVHVEHAETVVRTACPACLLRTVHTLAGFRPVRLAHAVPISRIAGTAAPETLLFSVALEPVRGPPLA